MISFVRVALVPILLLMQVRPCTAGEQEPELQWPWLFGPHSNASAVDYGGAVKAMPTVRWKGTTFTKRCGGSICIKGMLLGGCQSLVMHDDRIYVAYFVGSQSPVVLDKRGEDEEWDQRFRSNIWKKFAADWQRMGYTEEDIPTLRRMEWNTHADDVMACLDARTGKLLWRTAIPGGINVADGSYGPHLTPAVDPTTGNVYLLSASLRLIGLDGKTGEVLWINEDHPKCFDKKQTRAHCIAGRKAAYVNHQDYEAVWAVDGVVVVGGMAVDGRTGKVRWRTDNEHWFWLPWKHQGKWYLIKGGNECYDPLTGKELWHLPGDAKGTRTGPYGFTMGVSGDLLFSHDTCYRISPAGREVVWRKDDLEYGSLGYVAIRDGTIYASAIKPENVVTYKGLDEKERRKQGKKLMHGQFAVGLLSVDLATGENRRFIGPTGPRVGELVAFDGQVFCGGKDDNIWVATDAMPDGAWDKSLDLKPIDLPNGIFRHNVQITPIHKGLCYLRAGFSVACLDFRADPPQEAPVPQPDDPACAKLAGAVRDLGSAYGDVRRAAAEQLAADPATLRDALPALLTEANYATCRAACEALRGAGAKAAALAPVVEQAIGTARQGGATAARLAELFTALAAVDEAKALVLARSWFGADAVAARDVAAVGAAPAILAQLLPELEGVLKRGDEAALIALGRAMFLPDPTIYHPLIPAALEAIGRAGKLPLDLIETVHAALADCDDAAVHEAVLAFFHRHGKRPPRGSARLAQLYETALRLLGRCPVETIAVVKDQLVPLAMETKARPLIKRLGERAIPDLEALYAKEEPKSKLRDVILMILRGMGDAGEAAAAKLEKGTP